jgi:hypothetical protein
VITEVLITDFIKAKLLVMDRDCLEGPMRRLPVGIGLHVRARSCLVRQPDIEKAGLLRFSSNGTRAAIGYPNRWCLQDVH